MLMETAHLSTAIELPVCMLSPLPFCPTITSVTSFPVPVEVLFPASRLAKVDGVQSRKIYMAILGRMFDVTQGWQHYGGYSTPSATDAPTVSRASRLGRMSGSEPGVLSPEPYSFIPLGGCQPVLQG